MATMKNMPVSYNIDDPKQRKMLEWVLSKGKYSTVIKQLIEEAMEREKKVPKGTGIRFNLSNAPREKSRQ